jgi:hypothetical protein
MNECMVVDDLLCNAENRSSVVFRFLDTLRERYWLNLRSVRLKILDLL